MTLIRRQCSGATPAANRLTVYYSSIFKGGAASIGPIRDGEIRGVGDTRHTETTYILLYNALPIIDLLSKAR